MLKRYIARVSLGIVSGLFQNL